MFGLFFKFLLALIYGFLLWFFLDSAYWFLITPKPNKCDSIKFKESSFFNKLFIQIPRQIGIDRANFDKNVFDASGLILFEGKQGFGKTISMIRYASLLKARFPEALVVSNTKTIFNDIDLYGWKPLTDTKNGKFGVIVLLDEISIWFNNRNYKNFPPEMIQVITQNRKNRRVILGTCQNLTMCDKAIRLQTTCIVKAFTLCNCITINLWQIPDFDSEGNIVKRRFKKITWFVQDDFLRSCYDTYSVIDTLSTTGFMERSNNGD